MTNNDNIKKNSILRQWNTPFETPPFDKIKFEDFYPAILYCIKQSNMVLDKIKHTKEPTFENIIEPFEQCDNLITDVLNILYSLDSCNTNDDIQKVLDSVNPLIIDYNDSRFTDVDVFDKIRYLYDNIDNYYLTKEQTKLLKDTYKAFIKSGILLSDKEKKRLNELDNILINKTNAFNKNIMKATVDNYIEIDDKSILKGIPQYAIDNALEEGKRRGKNNYIFTLDQNSYSNILTYCADRDIRKEMWVKYNSRCSDGKNDNKKVIMDIINSQYEMAKLLGYDTISNSILDDMMAKNSKNVYNFLNDLYYKIRPLAVRDFYELQNYANSKGCDYKIDHWDRLYWTEKEKEELYHINPEQVREYLSLDNVLNAIFTLANRLYDLHFVKNDKIPVYNNDVIVYEVYKNNTFKGILYMDLYTRDNKNSGAWENVIRCSNKDTRPFVLLVNNLPKKSKNKPTLLSFNDVIVLLHEFGHCLHQLLTRGRYESLSGTNVEGDFVECPSQFNENYAYEESFLVLCAKHYESGKKMPKEMIKNIIKSKNFDAPYTILYQLFLCYLDMAFHNNRELMDDEFFDKIEEEVSKQRMLIPLYESCRTANTFTHIFAGGYGSTYYGYLYSQVMAIDAFIPFKENGIFNKEMGHNFERCILSKGGSEDAVDLYTDYRGKLPDVSCLLKFYGLEK